MWRFNRSGRLRDSEGLEGVPQALISETAPVEFTLKQDIP